MDTTADRVYAMERNSPRMVAWILVLPPLDLEKLLPDDRVVVSDGGHFIGWANMFWEPSAPDRLAMVGTAFQSIGLGWHSVAGAARANQDSTIVLTTGDGGGAMALSDLDTAIRSAGGEALAVGFNDAAYGAEVNLYGLKGLERVPDAHR